MERVDILESGLRISRQIPGVIVERISALQWYGFCDKIDQALLPLHELMEEKRRSVKKLSPLLLRKPIMMRRSTSKDRKANVAERLRQLCQEYSSSKFPFEMVAHTPAFVLTPPHEYNGIVYGWHIEVFVKEAFWNVQKMSAEDPFAQCEDALAALDAVEERKRNWTLSGVFDPVRKSSSPQPQCEQEKPVIPIQGQDDALAALDAAEEERWRNWTPITSRVVHPAMVTPIPPPPAVASTGV